MIPRIRETDCGTTAVDESRFIKKRPTSIRGEQKVCGFFSNMPNAGFENLSGKYASIHLKQVASLRVPEKKIVKNAMVYKKRNIVSNNQEAQNVQSSSGTTLARYRRLIGMYARRQVYICYRIGSANALVTRTKRQAVFTIQTAARRRVYHWRTKHKMSVRIQSVVRMKLAYKIVLIRRSEYRNDSAKKVEI